MLLVPANNRKNCKHQTRMRIKFKAGLFITRLVKYSASNLTSTQVLV